MYLIVCDGMANALRTKACCPCREMTDGLLMNPLMVVTQHCCWYTVFLTDKCSALFQNLFFSVEVKFLMTITPRWLMRGMERK